MYVYSASETHTSASDCRHGNMLKSALQRRYSTSRCVQKGKREAGIEWEVILQLLSKITKYKTNAHNTIIIRDN